MTVVEPRDRPWDAGLQPERTLLAWRRTCLAVGVGGLLFVRFGVADLGAIAVALGVAVLLLAALAYVDAACRYRRTHARLRTGDSPAAPVPIALLAASVVLAGIACAAWTLVRG